LGLIHINSHICQAERQIGIPRATIHRLLQSVRYRPYHTTLIQELSAECEHNFTWAWCITTRSRIFLECPVRRWSNIP